MTQSGANRSPLYNSLLAGKKQGILRFSLQNLPDYRRLNPRFHELLGEYSLEIAGNFCVLSRESPEPTRDSPAEFGIPRRTCRLHLSCPSIVCGCAVKPPLEFVS